MPEGPELRINSLFINHMCKGRVFSSQPTRSSVTKNPEIKWDSRKYTITSESRGKELALFLNCLERTSRKMRILFRFGMSGKFAFTKIDSIPKHAHLQFHTAPKGSLKKEEGLDVLSFVDVRRFGSWRVTDDWGEERGPDILNEYEQFRANVLENLEDAAFNRPICEAMLNQKYFNGIGNYLRAEVLFRVKVPPFTCARSVLERLTQDCTSSSADILCLCRDVSQEVIQLKTDLGKTESSSVTEEDHTTFLQWLQCYNNPDMSIMKDKNGRTIWFHGAPGPMAPKNRGGVKAPKRRRQPDNPLPVSTAMSSTDQGNQDSELKEEETISNSTNENSRSKKRKVTKTTPVKKQSEKSQQTTGNSKRKQSQHLPSRRSARLADMKLK